MGRNRQISLDELRSEDDYGAPAERILEAKRLEYFAAGTAIVWDVDILQRHVVDVYRVGGPAVPVSHGRGTYADAEPALPGWSMPVDDLFPPA